MFDGKKILAVIPARGGSKGIPGKNIRLIGGKPLIAYTVAAALGSSYVDRVVVSTDSQEIARIALSCGAEVPFLRPDELAQDTSKTVDSIVHARDWLLRNSSGGDGLFDAIAVLQPTSPLRRAEELDRALECFFMHGALGLVSVAEVSENPVLIRRMDRFGILHPLLPMGSTIRRQDMPVFYRVDGAICINSNDDLSLETSLNDNPIGFVMPRMRSVDIDSMEDFQLAEKYLMELGDLS